MGCESQMVGGNFSAVSVWGVQVGDVHGNCPRINVRGEMSCGSNVEGNVSLETFWGMS